MYATIMTKKKRDINDVFTGASRRLDFTIPKETIKDNARQKTVSTSSSSHKIVYRSEDGESVSIVVFSQITGKP